MHMYKSIYIYVNTQHTDTYESRGVYTVSLHICIYDIHISHNLIFLILPFFFLLNFTVIYTISNTISFQELFHFCFLIPCGGLKETDPQRAWHDYEVWLVGVGVSL